MLFFQSRSPRCEYQWAGACTSSACGMFRSLSSSIVDVVSSEPARLLLDTDEPAAGAGRMSFIPAAVVEAQRPVCECQLDQLTSALNS